MSIHQPLSEPLGLQVDKLHLICLVKYPVRNALRHRSAQDGKDRVLNALNVVNVQGRIDVNSRLPQLLNVLIALHMAAGIRIPVGQILNHNQLRVPLEAGIQVDFIRYVPIPGHFFTWQYLKCLCQCRGFGPLGIGEYANGHVQPCLFGLSGRFQHGIALPSAGEIAGKNREFPLFSSGGLPRRCNRIHGTPSSQTGVL